MFYDIFKSLCDSKGISVTKATEEIGLARTIATKWKQTEAVPRGDTLTKIADYFGVSVSYLMGEDNNNQLLDDSDEIKALREAMRNKPEMRILFDALKDASVSDYLEAAAVVMRRKEERNK